MTKRRNTKKTNNQSGCLTILVVLIIISCFSCGGIHKKEQPGSVSTASKPATIKPVVTEVPARKDSVLEQLLYTVSPESKISEIEDRAKELELYYNWKFVAGSPSIKEYKFALYEDVANVFLDFPPKGSYIMINADTLNDGVVTKVKYFSENRMLSAFWSSDGGYSMIDYNDPARYSGRFKIESFSALQDYSPSVITDDNALETLFLKASGHMTKDDILQYIDENGLYYYSRNNYMYVALDNDMLREYGLVGSYLDIDFDSERYVSKVEYYDYVSYYWNKSYAAFFLPGTSYSHPEYDGSYIVKPNDDVTAVADARTAINEIKSLRLAAQQRLGYAK